MSRMIFVIISHKQLDPMDLLLGTQKTKEMIPAISQHHANQVIKVWKENYGDDFFYGIIEMNI